ncbi:MAG: cytochrome c3 family protein [Nitrospirae bacterium]|nr:cytochrome c3 family protein [Nitrospirota bacterium]
MKFFKVVAGLGILAGGCVVAFFLLVYGPYMTPKFGNPAPVQPINFPHDRHAGTDVANGQLGLPCTACHIFAERSEQAGAPPLQFCMGCHLGIGLDKPGIQKLREYYDKGESVEWARVHTLPYFIRFSHKRHVKAGFQCQECHGAVEKMAVLTREAPLQMGWCFNCHKLHEDKGGSQDCWTCHK